MSGEALGTRSEFDEFRTKYDADQKEFKDLLKDLSQSLQTKSHHQHQDVSDVNSIQRFEGVLIHPKSGRTSKQSSFVNVAARLKTGIEVHNQENNSANGKIVTKEFNGSLLSWTHNAMASIRGVIGRYGDMNSALGECSLDEVRKTDRYQAKPFKYNRDVSSIIREIRKILPIVVLAKGDWAARELLKNTFQNSKAARTRKQKETKLSTKVQVFELSEGPDTTVSKLPASDCIRSNSSVRNSDDDETNEQANIDELIPGRGKLLARRIEKGLKKMVDHRHQRRNSSKKRTGKQVEETLQDITKKKLRKQTTSRRNTYNKASENTNRGRIYKKRTVPGTNHKQKTLRSNINSVKMRHSRITKALGEKDNNFNVSENESYTSDCESSSVQSATSDENQISMDC